MTWAASHLANNGASSEELYKGKTFTGRRRRGKEVILANSGLFQARSPSFRGRLGLKPCTSGWDLNPAKTLIETWTQTAGTQTQPKPTVFQLRSHTWFQDLMKLSFLMSHHRKNSVRDKVISKEWIYLERNTLHRQSVGHLRRWERHQGMRVVSFYWSG